MSFHRIKAQAEPPHKEENGFQTGSSNVPISTYMSAFQGKTNTNI